MVDIEKYFGKNTKMKGMEDYFGKNTKMNGMEDYFGKKDFKGIDNVFKDVKKGFNMSMNSIQGNAFNKMVKQPEFLSRKRIKQQGMVNMFGDFDGDKVPNLLDCWPKDAKRQGASHDVSGFVEEKDQNDKEITIKELKEAPSIKEVDAEYDKSYTPVGKAYGGNTEVTVGPKQIYESKNKVSDINYEYNFPNTTEKTSAVGKISEVLSSGAKGVGKGLAAGAREVYKASPAYSTPEEKSAKMKHKFDMEKIREMGRTDALKESEKMRAKSLYMKEFAKGMPPRYCYPAGRMPIRSQFQMGMFPAQPTGIDRALLPASEAIKSFSISGHPGYIGASMIQGGPVDDFAVKVDDAMGKGTLRPQYEQQKMQQQRQQMQMAPQQVGQPQFNTESTKMSPYSKRKVSYTRGPYKKRLSQ